MRDGDISRFMTTEPTTVAPDTPASEARALLASETMHHLPVVDEGRLVGIVSTSDLLKLYLLDDHRAGSLATVSQIMEDEPMVLHERATLREAAEVLSLGGFHALPIVDEAGRLVGILTSTDLIDHLLHQLPRGDGSIPDVSTDALQARNRVLERVCRAAELYMRSGNAEHEHSELLKALDAARARSENVTR